jgi:rare lipoprotein A
VTDKKGGDQEMSIRSLSSAIFFVLLAIPVSTTTSPSASLPSIGEIAPRSVENPWHQTLLHQIGTASWYGGKFHGRLTASGTRFDKRRLTAAHRTLPLGTKARIVNLENGRSVEVTVTDRGPYVRGRIIDLSEKAAQLLGMEKSGLAAVSIEISDVVG